MILYAPTALLVLWSIGASIAWARQDDTPLNEHFASIPRDTSRPSRKDH